MMNAFRLLSTLTLGPLIILTANIFFTVSFSLAKFLTAGTTIWIIMFFRFLAGPAYLGTYCAIKKKPVPIHDWPLLLIRVGCGMGAMSSLFFAYKYGGIAKSTLIFELSILWTVIIEAFVLKKPLHRYSMASLPLAFIGLMMVLNIDSFQTIERGDLFAFVGSILNAGVYLSLKKLRHHHDTLTLVFWTYLFSCLFMLLPASRGLLSLDPQQLYLLVSLCSFGLIGQLLMTLGFKFSSASVSSLFMMSIVPFTAISGAIFFNEVFTLQTTTGVVFVVLSLMIVAKYR